MSPLTNQNSRTTVYRYKYTEINNNNKKDLVSHGHIKLCTQLNVSAWDLKKKRKKEKDISTVDTGFFLEA